MCSSTVPGSRPPHGPSRTDPGEQASSGLQVEELADVGRTLGAQPARLLVVGQPGDLLGALFYQREREDGQVGAHHTATDGLTLAAAGAALAVAGHALLE